MDSSKRVWTGFLKGTQQAFCHGPKESAQTTRACLSIECWVAFRNRRSIVFIAAQAMFDRGKQPVGLNNSIVDGRAC